MPALACSFETQHVHRIDARRPPCWDPARQERDGGQDAEHAGDRKRVERVTTAQRTRSAFPPAAKAKRVRANAATSGKTLCSAR